MTDNRDIADVNWYQGELDHLRRENDLLWLALLVLPIAMFIFGDLVGVFV